MRSPDRAIFLTFGKLVRFVCENWNIHKFLDLKKIATFLMRTFIVFFGCTRKSTGIRPAAKRRNVGIQKVGARGRRYKDVFCDRCSRLAEGLNRW